MVDFEDWSKLDVHILLAGSPENEEGTRVGMGFVIGPRHVLTCAHVVAESLGDRDQWVDRTEKPSRTVTLAFAFSARHQQPIEATIEHWWPEYSKVRNRPELDDVALLRLPDGLTLPADVQIASRASRFSRGQEVFANGVTQVEQNGVSLAGEVRGDAFGNRVTILTEGGDGGIVEGYSGAAVVTREGDVVGMIAERQQGQTALFISINWLLQAPPISAAWQTRPRRASFVEAMTPRDSLPPEGVTRDASEWLRMPIAARLQRHLPDCDRVDIYRNIEDFAFAPGARRPAVAVFGSDADDVPEALYDRFKSKFLVEAGYSEAEIVYPPNKWELETLPWRREGESVKDALAAMKRRLVRVLSAEGPEPDKIREALSSGTSQAFYSEAPLELVGPEDSELLKAWSGYLTRVGKGGLSRSLVHLVCVKCASPEGSSQARDLAAEVRNLAAAGHKEVVLHEGLLPRLKNDDLNRWLDMVARRVPLDGGEIFELRNRATRELLAGGAPRLRQLDEWLAQLRYENQ